MVRPRRFPRSRLAHTRKKVWLLILLFVVIGVAVYVAKVQFFTSKANTAKQQVRLTPQKQNSPKPTPPKPQGLTVPANFTLEQKVGQLLVVGVTDTTVAVDLETKYQIGGFLLNTGANLFSKAATDQVKQASSLPVIIAVDQEGGYVSRLPDQSFKRYTAQYMGALPDAQVQQIGTQMGQSLAAIGANVNFAPVLDLDDGHNAAISYWERSFSSDPAIVAQKASAFAAGLRAANVVPTFKHFPGLGYATGSTNGDTDAGPATTPPLTVLEQRDLLPYKVIQTSDPSAVMVGNQIVPGLTNGMPASISSGAYGLLRKTYNFQQVTFTDEIADAKSVAQVESTPTQAVIDALKGGADMPLVNVSSEQEVADIITGVTQAVQNGQLSSQRVNEALGRAMALKTWIKQHGG